MTQLKEACDVAVVGGGPAGSTVATLLVRRGWHVILLEKTVHPRFHIGESLLPCSLPVLERLGVADVVAAMGQRKPGAEFVSTRYGRRQRYYFADALGKSPDHAYQVRRAEFDALLLENAVRAGVDVRQGVRACAPDWKTSEVRISLSGPVPAGAQLSARQLVDASGRDTLVARALRCKRPNPKHASAAVFAHFEGANLDTGPDRGNIKIFWFEYGWLWFIPFRDTTVSVGAVCSPDYLRMRAGSIEAFLDAAIAHCPALAGYLDGSRRLGAAGAAGNYSYESEALTGDRWVAVGDAGAFVDPIFSSGVHLALTGAEAASSLVDARLRGRTFEARRRERGYRRQTRRGIRRFSWFIYRVTNPVMEWLFVHPSDRFCMRAAVISVLAGDVYRNGPVRLPLLMFRAVYSAKRLRAWWRARCCGWVASP